MRRLIALAVLCGVLVAGVVGAAEPTALKVKTLYWTGAYYGGAAIDTMMIAPGDTLRTQWIDTSDWDWSWAIGAGPYTATPAAIARIYVIGQPGTYLSADSLYYSIETRSPVLGDTLWSYNSGFTAAVGSCATAYATLKNCVFTGLLLADPTSYAATNVFFTRYLRLRFKGDLTGYLPGAKVVIVYPKRGGTS